MSRSRATTFGPSEGQCRRGIWISTGPIRHEGRPTPRSGQFATRPVRTGTNLGPGIEIAPIEANTPSTGRSIPQRATTPRCRDPQEPPRHQRRRASLHPEVLRLAVQPPSARKRLIIARSPVEAMEQCYADKLELLIKWPRNRPAPDSSLYAAGVCDGQSALLDPCRAPCPW